MRHCFLFNHLTRKLRISLSLVICLLALEKTAFADFECYMESFYKWRKPKSETDLEVLVGRSMGKGSTEPDARSALELQIAEEQKKARSECLKDHQNSTQCLATKYQVLSGVLGSLGFSARKEMENTIKSECEAMLGECTDIKISEMKCQEKKPPETVAPAEGAGDKGKKGDKKAEKKK